MINDVDFNAVIFIVEDGESLFRIAAMKPDFVGDVLRQPLLNKVYAENLFRDLLLNVEIMISTFNKIRIAKTK